MSNQAYMKMLRLPFVMTCVIVGGLCVPCTTVDGGRPFASANFSELHVQRQKNLSDLYFTWDVRPPFNYDAFNVRVRTSDGRESQHEVQGGRTGGFWIERNAEVGLTYTFKVQGCDKGTFGSKCTPWTEIQFRNISGNNFADRP
jgi:hypothetical protein